MSLLSRDAILNANDIQSEDVHVPAWDGIVKVRGLTGEQRDAFEEAMIEGRGKNRQVRLTNLRAKLVALCVIDEKGDRMFTDADAAQLGRKSAAALSVLYDVAARLSGLTDEDVEELTANLSSSPGAGSS
jgi:hypothetical protein